MHPASYATTYTAFRLDENTLLYQGDDKHRHPLLSLFPQQALVGWARYWRDTRREFPG